jgi:hypothetical protein
MMARLVTASAHPKALAFSSTAMRKLVSFGAQTKAAFLLELVVYSNALVSSPQLLMKF